MKRASTAVARAGTLAFVFLSSLPFLSCIETTNPPLQVITPTMTISPAGPLSLVLGQTVTIVASTTGLFNGVITYTSSDPAAATVNATTGVVTGGAGGSTTITIRATGTDNTGAAQTISATVQVSVTNPTLALDNMTKASDGTVVPPASVSDRVFVNYNMFNAPVGSGFSAGLLIDGNITLPCNTLSGNRVICPFETTFLDGATGLPRFLNGTHTMAARLTGPNGIVVASPSTTLTLTNSNIIGIQVNDPPNPPADIWRAGDLSIITKAVLYDGNTDPITAGLRITLPNTRVSGNGNVVLNSTQVNPFQFDFRVNPVESANVEGTFQFTPVVFNGAGANISSRFRISSFSRNIDLVPPRATYGAFPSMTLISAGGVNLGHMTGPYTAGTIIPLVRITGGQNVRAHLPFCDSWHLHGSITIARETGGGSDGPFTDPEITFSDPCGHGKLLNVPLDQFFVPFQTNVTDGSPINGRVELFTGVNGCDMGSLFDDTPLPAGNGPGQTPNPFFVFSQSPASGTFPVKPAPGMGNSFLCVRTTINDSAVNAQGQKANTLTKVQITQLIDFLNSID